VEAAAAGDISIDLLATELVEHARTSAAHSLANRTLAYLLAGGFLAGAIALAAFAPPLRAFSPLSAVVALVAFTAVSRVTFEVGNGWVFATQLVTVPMLFALPPRDVPLLVAAGYLLGEAPAFARGRVRLIVRTRFAARQRRRNDVRMDAVALRELLANEGPRSI